MHKLISFISVLTLMVPIVGHAAAAPLPDTQSGGPIESRDQERVAIDQALDEIAARGTLDASLFHALPEKTNLTFAALSLAVGLPTYYFGENVARIRVGFKDFGKIERIAMSRGYRARQIAHGILVPVGQLVTTIGATLAIIEILKALGDHFGASSIGRGLMERGDGPSQIADLVRSEVGRSTLREIALRDKKFAEFLFNLAR